MMTTKNDCTFPRKRFTTFQLSRIAVTTISVVLAAQDRIRASNTFARKIRHERGIQQYLKHSNDNNSIHQNQTVSIVDELINGNGAVGIIQSQDGSLSLSSTGKADPLFGQVHIMRRLYGEENAAVRSEISMIEERIPRYQTGIPADSNHIVSYDNHPFERLQRARNLQDDTTNATISNTTTTDTTSSTGESGFRNMRISFYTKALDDIRDSSNAAKIDWYKNVILPIAADYWSQALQVIPVYGNLRISSGELDSFTYCGDSEFTTVPNEHKTDGVADTDLILYVSGSKSDRFCPDRTLAVAVPCNFDQYDRPIAGAVNVCLDNIELQSDGTALPNVVGDYVDVTIHEVAHVLGHSSNSYRFFWDPDTGTPRTPRPFESKTTTCVNGESKSLIVPDENTMVFVSDDYGRRYASIVTPKVKSIAQNQFDCPTLEGGRLENQPTRADSCTGDHWDERLFYPEALSGVISPTTNILSSLTLALFEDTGWYRANYTGSRMSPWGLGAGCDFVYEPCLVAKSSKTSSGSNTSASSSGPSIPDYAKGFFCIDETDKGCSSEHTHKMTCTILDYYYFVPQELPEDIYQYFPDEPTKGGPKQADYCPVYGTAYNNLKVDQLECSNSDNTPALNVYR
jgi:Leishmanolysin